MLITQHSGRPAVHSVAQTSLPQGAVHEVRCQLSAKWQCSWLTVARVPPQQPGLGGAGSDGRDPAHGAKEGSGDHAYYYDFSIAPELGGAGTLLRRMRERQQQLTASILGSGAAAGVEQPADITGP